MNIPTARIAPTLTVFCLALTASCSGGGSPEAAEPEPSGVEEPTAVPTASAAPQDRFDVRCERVLSSRLRESHMYGWPMTESTGPDRATCTFDQEPFKRIIVAIDCGQRATSDDRVAQVRRALEAAGHREASSPGRLAFVTREGVPTTFWDDDSECEVTVDRVGWNEPDAAGIARAHAVADALTPASIQP